MDPQPVDAYVIDFENLHYIQRDILSRLNHTPRLPHSALKPPELTGNSFNYHLRHVIAQKIVAQDSDGQYHLTPRGRLLADNISLPSMKLKIRPVSGVYLLVKSAHGYLLYESSRETTRNLTGLPFGKLRLGDSVNATLGRMLIRHELDRANVRDLENLGQANVRYFLDGELVLHRLAVVWSCSYSGEAIEHATDNGRDLWIESLTGQTNLLPEVAAIATWPTGEKLLEITGQLTG